MTLRFKQLYYFAFIAIVFSLSTGAFAQNRSYRVNDRQVETLLNRIETNTDAFRQSIERAFNNNNQYNQNNQNESYRNEGIVSYVNDFENATDDLKSNFADRNSTVADVQEVLNRSAYINNFMRDNRVTTETQNQWKLIRTDLNTLATYYRVSWNWNKSANPQFQVAGFDARLTGTYRLNVGQSDNVSTTIDNAISNSSYNANQRERTKNNLERRLTSPDMLMIEKQGQTVTLGSSNSSQASFSADGVTRSESSNNGRTVKIRATSTKTDLTINYEGDRMNDFFVSFTPVGYSQLNVVRRIYLENRNETVTVKSVYDKINRTAQWDTTNYPNTTVSNNDVNEFVIPNNTRLTATLDTPLSTKTVKDADRFTMTVTSPSQYQGAIIQGSVIGEKSGIVSGRATISLNFETIRLTNGNTYRFTGIVEQVRQPNGDQVKVDNEGSVRDKNQTTKTATRAGIGAVIGAIIGAVAGGGQGAAIGAVIGGGAGAGTVILGGRDNLELQNGSEFTITSTAPANVARNQ